MPGLPVYGLYPSGSFYTNSSEAFASAIPSIFQDLYGCRCSTKNLALLSMQLLLLQRDRPPSEGLPILA